MRVKPEPRRWLFIQKSAWFFLLCHRVWWENVKEEDVASYRQLWSCFAERDVMEQSREFSKEIKEGGGKVIKQYRTVFVSQGFLFFFMMQLLLYSSTTGQKQKQIDIFFADNMNEKRRTKISDETSVQLLLQPLLMGVCIHPSIHSSVEPFTHNYVNYIPLQCHMFAVTSHTTTENNEQTERQK